MCHSCNNSKILILILLYTKLYVKNNVILIFFYGFFEFICNNIVNIKLNNIYVYINITLFISSSSSNNNKRKETLIQCDLREIETKHEIQSICFRDKSMSTKLFLHLSNKQKGLIHLHPTKSQTPTPLRKNKPTIKTHSTCIGTQMGPFSHKHSQAS